MSIFGKPKGEKYHTRTIEMSTYKYDDLRFAVEGILCLLYTSDAADE